MTSSHDITALLIDWSQGRLAALNEVLPLVYSELKRVAARQLRAEGTGHTLQPTALVHEVYLRLVNQRKVDWRDRAHFYGVSAELMRRILVDHARRQMAKKRGRANERVPLADAAEIAANGELPLLAFDRALSELAAVDPDLAKLVEMRAFSGMTTEEAACVLNVSASTAKRDWRAAKAWLNRQLSEHSHG